MAALGEESIRQKLAKMQGWSYQGKEIQKKYTFKSFLPGIEFVNRIAKAAEAAGHHPDITINYNVVGISLSTTAKVELPRRTLPWRARSTRSSARGSVLISVVAPGLSPAYAPTGRGATTKLGHSLALAMP